MKVEKLKPCNLQKVNLHKKNPILSSNSELLFGTNWHQHVIVGHADQEKEKEGNG